MSVIDEILEHNEEHVGQFSGATLPMPPAKKLAVVACMDARLETGVLLKAGGRRCPCHQECRWRRDG